MPSAIYYRIAGNALSLALQSTNSVVMLLSLKEDILRDPEIRDMAFLQNRYITVWNVILQMLYFSLALVCDISTVTHKDYLLPKSIKNFRDLAFSALLFPLSLFISAMFWPIYLYDRDIIYPTFIDRAFYPECGYIVHLAIVPSVLWELAYQPRKTPKNHAVNLLMLLLLYLAFNSVMYYTYFEHGLWPYPLMGMVHGNVLEILLHLYVCCLIIGSYFLQWRLRSYFWRNEDSEKIKAN